MAEVLTNACGTPVVWEPCWEPPSCSPTENCGSPGEDSEGTPSSMSEPWGSSKGLPCVKAGWEPEEGFWNCRGSAGVQTPSSMGLGKDWGSRSGSGTRASSTGPVAVSVLVPVCH